MSKLKAVCLRDRLKEIGTVFCAHKRDDQTVHLRAKETVNILCERVSAVETVDVF